MFQNVSEFDTHDDKLYHLLAGAVIALSACLLLCLQPALLPLWCAALAGAVKEYADRAHGCRWDWLDLLATAAPGAVGTLIMYAI